ncbi:MAG: hypothetical protein IT578_07285 [Verrucomicrobiae bacterium]|nr:hypothetical protein [Verrucomicrobiae bacterium]
MKRDRQLIEHLTERARYLRRRGLAINGRTLHAGAALSSADIIAVLFYHALRIDPQHPAWEDRDIFINSRGHGAEPIFVALADRGFFPKADLDQMEEAGCHLHGLTAATTPGIEFSCGSLGQGLSLGVGTALGKRARRLPGRVFVVAGDGECQEGSVWEAAMTASHYRLDTVTLIVDRNGYQSSDRDTETVMELEPLEDKFRAFGFAVRRINGHDIAALVDAMEALPFEPGKPSAIIADTIKGKGVSFFESGHVHCGRFGRDLSPELFERALRELGGGELQFSPEFIEQRLAGARKEVKLGYTGIPLSNLLIEYATQDPRVCYVGVDTMEVPFQKQFPDRAFDVGIAEQDELTVATGLAKMGMLPVVQAWSPFTPIRNFDQLRTSLTRHNANVKIISTALGLANCSHGASHHDMESLALFRVVPNLVVLAPFDARQFAQAFRVAMAHVGPVVILGPPEIYAPGNEGLPAVPRPDAGGFRIGQSEWLRHGRGATLITFGAPLRYAWAAATQLSAGLINMCSLKPLDEAAIIQAATESRALVTVEEQNAIGGLGSAVAEVIAERGLRVKFKRLGIPDQFVEDVGDYTETRATINLTAAGVARAVTELLRA